MRDDQGLLRRLAWERTADFVSRKGPLRDAHDAPDWGTAGPSDDDVEKRAPRNYGTLSHARIHCISLSERLRRTRNRYVRKLRMQPLTVKSRHDAVSFAPINPPRINSFFLSSPDRRSGRNAITHKKRLISCYVQEMFFPRLSASLSNSDTSAILRAN